MTLPGKPSVAGCGLVHKYDWPKQIAYAVCMGESRGNSNAVGDTNTAYVSCGLMQIRTLPGRPSCERLKDAEYNVAYAYNMWKGQGWKPWSAYNNGSYKKYM